MDDQYAALQKELNSDNDFSSQKETIDNGYLDNPDLGQKAPENTGYLQEKEPEPQPEPETQEPTITQEEVQQQKTVPHAALHQSREQYKQLKDQFETRNQEFDDLKSKFNELQSNINQQKQQEEQRSLQDLDPYERQNLEIENLKKQLNQLNNFNSSVIEQSNRMTAEQQLQSRYSSAVREFESQQPDIMDAYSHAISSRQSQLQAMGYNSQEIADAIKYDEYQLAQRAFNAGANPGEFIYQYAKSLGYVNQAEEQARINNEKLNNVNQNIQTQGNLSTVSGAPTSSSELTPESFLNLPLSQQTDDMWREMVKKF